jgi:NOL1/NOP2/sun family putative RNA methylase
MLTRIVDDSQEECAAHAVHCTPQLQLHVMPESHEFFAAYADFIPAFPAFCEAVHTKPPCCVRVNTLRTEPDLVQAMLASQGYQAIPSPLASEVLLVDRLTHPGTLREALLGYYQPQALTSALASLVLAPQPDESVCDLCAAPGSKTTHMAQLMRDQGVIVANDRRDKRLSMLEHNLRRLGISNVVTTCYAGQNFPLRCKFQRVLVDAPCSGEGNYRWDARGRLLHYRRSQGDLPRLQTQLLVRGFDLLAEGGTLLYATCTYNPAENEAVVQALLEQRPATLQPITLEAPHCPGLRRWRTQIYDSSMAYCWRLYPHYINSVGFFLACIRA